MLASVLLAVLCGCLDGSPPRHHGCASGAPTAAERATAIGFCLLEKGWHTEALAEFDRALEHRPDYGPAHFGAGWVSLLIQFDALYRALYDLSLQQDASLTQLADWLEQNWLGGELSGALPRIASHFAWATSDPSLRIASEGTVVRVRALEVYLDFWEFDTADAWFLGGITELLEALTWVVTAHDLDIPVSEALVPGEAIYRLNRLDLEDAFDRHPDFLTLNDEGPDRMEQARTTLIHALGRLRGAIVPAMAETDNQSEPDLADDYPDLLQQSLLTWDGDVFIPGIFGPSPMTAILQALFLADRDGAIEQIADLFPGAPAALPDAFDWILERVIAALEGTEPLTVGGLNVSLSSVFSLPLDLRSLITLAEAAAENDDGNSILTEGLASLPNRVTADVLPWEHPELYEPVTDLAGRERDRLRGFDGPAAEVHVGNGELHAGLTREGRLKNLFFPGLTSFNLVPYITRVRPPILETEPVPYMGANPEHGSFAGLRIGGAVTWLMDWLDYRHYNPMQPEGRNVRPSYLYDDAPIVRIDYRDPASSLQVSETTFVPRWGDAEDERLNVVARTFSVANTGTNPETASLVYYGAFNLTDIDQYIVSASFWVAWLRRPNIVSTNGQQISWSGPGWVEHPKGASAAIVLTTDPAPDRLGIGELTRDGDLGAWALAETGATATGSIATDFGNGYIEVDLGTIPAGAQRSVTVYIGVGAGSDADAARADAQAQIDTARQPDLTATRERTRMFWQEWVAASAQPPADLPEPELRMFRRAAMVLKLDQAVLTGALPELWDMQPMWFMVWPGNGAWHAAAHAALGHLTETRAYFDYAARTQARDGHWRMAYTTLGDEHGAFEVENYQTGAVVWLAWLYWTMSGDDAWLAQWWPHARLGADFLLSRIAQNGLTYGTPDFVEDIDAFRQSLFTNTIVTSSFVAAGLMAEAIGQITDATRYFAAAGALYDRVIETYWIEDEGMFWEQFDMNGTHGKGGVPTMSWPFHTFALDDPRMTQLAHNYVVPQMQDQDWLTFKDSHDWTPALTKNAAFLVNHYNATNDQASLDAALDVLNGILNPVNLTLGGFIAERFFG
ncbi:MAG: hypothetical protein D6761_05375, partial [Candidatus Dadabacteria bacterium]